MKPFHFGYWACEKLAEQLPGMPAPTTSLSGPSKLPTSPPPSGTMSLTRNSVPQPELRTTGTTSRNPGPAGSAAPETPQATLFEKAVQSAPGQKAVQGLSNAGSWYERNFSPATRQTFNDMSANSARVSGGILSTVAGGIGALGTGVASGATELWNMATPKSMNTSEGWSQGVNDVFKKTVDFAGAGARDVYGGLGGNTDYNTQHSWNQMEAGFNDPNVDPTTRAIASGAGWAGHGMWNLATAASNPGKVLAGAPGLARVGQYGRAVNRLDDLAATPFEFGNAMGNAGVELNHALQSEQ